MKHVTTTVKTRTESFLARATKSFALAAGAVVFCLLQASAADLVWYRTKAEAVAAAKASSKLIFLVNGRDTCPNTMYVKNTACETASLKKLLLSDFVVWYNDCDARYEDVWQYRSDLGTITLPLVCILDPNNMNKYLARHTGFAMASEIETLIKSVVKKPGTIVVSAPVPLSVKAGNKLRMKFARQGGSDGKIAVKAKTQTSTALMGVGGSADFDYVKKVMEWGDGDTSEKYIDVPTYVQPWEGTKQLRVKLSTLATGAYAGNLVPKLEVAKIYVDLENPSKFGTVSVEPENSKPTAGQPLRLVFRRAGGSSWPIAVKYKVQTSTAIAGVDFEYMKDVVTWGNGESGVKYVEIPTYASGAGKTLRVKLSTLTQGAYQGCVTPHVKEAKVYIPLYDCNTCFDK